MLVSTLIRFQFLIGSLKTHQRLSEIARGTRFQFLIGSLKTYIEYGKPEAEFSFNSS